MDTRDMQRVRESVWHAHRALAIERLAVTTKSSATTPQAAQRHQRNHNLSSDIEIFQLGMACAVVQGLKRPEPGEGEHRERQSLVGKIH